MAVQGEPNRGQRLDPVAGVALRRVLAPNPSALTGPGTNSWLLGRGAVTVIDPGPALPAHLAAILSGLDPGERIAQIIVTHAHLDHSALAAELSRQTGAPVLAFGTAESGRSAVMQEWLAQGFQGGGEGADHAFRPDHCLVDGDQLPLPDSEARLEVLHVPGHMGGHIALALGEVLFSGDHVMGWSSTLVSPPDGCMASYMQSLSRLAARRWNRFLPGHGGVVEDPAARLTELITHRRAREAAILQALALGPASASEMAARIYTDTPPALLGAASRNILAHLIDLLEKGRVGTAGLPSLTAPFHAR